MSLHSTASALRSEADRHLATWETPRHEIRVAHERVLWACSRATDRANAEPEFASAFLSEAEEALDLLASFD